MKKLEYIATGGEQGFTDPLLIGKRILSVMKDGVGMSKIVTGTPTEKQAQYINSTGGVNFAQKLTSFVDVVVLYDDEANVCLPVAIPVFTLPDASAARPYSASFFISGSGPFTMTNLVKPAWLIIPDPTTQITFSGTPAASDSSGPNTVSFTLSNACGSVDFSQSLNVIVKDAQFEATTFVSGNRLNDVEIANLSGTPGVVVTVTLDTLTNTNGGILKVNGTAATVGNVYNVTIGLSGGTLNVEIDGIKGHGTVILGHFTITAVSGGAIGVSKTYQISKVF